MRHAAVKEVLSGIKRTHGTAQAGKAALLTEHLRRLLAVIPDSLLGKRDAAISLLGFAGAFRRSELVSFTIPDVEFNEDGLKVTIRRSKTDQEGQGRVVGVPYGSNPQLPSTILAALVKSLRHCPWTVIPWREPSWPRRCEGANGSDRAGSSAEVLPDGRPRCVEI
ncbi:MAG: integrase family protein [Candidatus Solibacter sp.]|nr:integrase family protein [Candidatus Solibacter sp.]